MEKQYQFLMEFSHGTTPCAQHLCNRYGAKPVNYALENGWIVACGKQDNGDTLYTITELGTQVRDH